MKLSRRGGHCGAFLEEGHLDAEERAREEEPEPTYIVKFSSYSGLSYPLTEASRVETGS